ncbi:DUF6708 domain-containing protein [Pseudomonas fontis]|uniref:DUF6708 domain-containing protein n=1 Tax=Pseudomonas fontis TaxID=2942633 RepID=A0ABT5NXB5_9PSED|nr:DUF6708 domain-containing protein [Pseudomonas fontis]MDD0974090.1 hypothetical protein [Pseudomonas fontis]MDD0992825.1 hypothetical protein [Pseudomonas fontis]
MKPLTSKPPGWKYNLPAPNQEASTSPRPNFLDHPPNCLTSVYLELHRSSLLVRGLWLFLGGTASAMTVSFTLVYVYLFIFFAEARHIVPLSGSLLIFMSMVWGAIPMIRIDIALPRDEPIRFNRLRRKVYVYRFHHSWLKPFSRRAWGVRPVAYNWDDLRAEAWMIYAPMGTGGLKEGITLAVIKPGTDEVIDRFHFAQDILKGEIYWALVQQFMQQGPQALPTFPRPPRDWNNEPATFNLARRWAPKVQWPADMDLESRTAPDQ